MPKPPEGASPPPLWGDEDHVRGLFAGTGVELEFEPRSVVFEHDSPAVFVDYMADNYGPLLKARERLSRRAAGRSCAPTWSRCASGRTWPRTASSPRPSTCWCAASGLSGRTRTDVVVVGGRCAGAVLALRLARAGVGVTMVDRDPIGTDTLSTHALFPNAVARLDELGLLDRLLSRHEVPALRYRLRVLGHESVGGFTPVGGFDRMIAPRRAALDRVLAETALEAGAEGRYGSRVTGLLGTGAPGDPVRGVVLDDGERIEAGPTVGADGRASTVAGLLGVPRERELQSEMAMLLGYWRGLPPTDVLRWTWRSGAGSTASPATTGSSCWR